VSCKDANRSMDDNAFTLIQYDLTDEPLNNPYLKKLSPSIRERNDDLYELALTKPKEVISEITDLIKKYPEVPMFYNYLSVAYSQLSDSENRDAVVLECYKKFPDYLFGRVNYAQLCLNNGNVEKIPEIFENKLELKLLYPQRTKFHISEYMSFMGLIGLYNVKIGERKIAEQYYKMLKQIDPGHRITKHLKRTLTPPLIIRLLLWLHKKITGKVVTLEEYVKMYTPH